MKLDKEMGRKTKIEVELGKDVIDALKKDNYSFNSFKKINLTPETSKILYDEKRLSFKHYKKYVDDDVVQRVIKEQEEEILRLLNSDKYIIEQHGDEYYNNWYRNHRKDIYEILDIVEEYDISLDFIIKALGIDQMGGHKSMIVHMLLDECMM